MTRVLNIESYTNINFNHFKSWVSMLLQQVITLWCYGT